jgi:hypothetical protein
MLGQECFGKINKIGNSFIITISPVRSECEAVAGLLSSFTIPFTLFLYVAGSVKSSTCGVPLRL